MLGDWNPFPIRTEKARLSTMTYEEERKAFLYFPVIKDEQLTALNQHLLGYTRFRKSRKRRFDPHVTLFWGKLGREDMREVRTLLSEGDNGLGQCPEWMCDNISLYVQKGQQWVPYHVYELS
jgi:2'-5' RNA ligase